MKFKKVMSLALAMIMALALTVPALAAETDTTQNSNMVGDTSVGAVSLTVTSNSKLVFNPSKIYVNIGSDGAAVSNGGTANNNQIIAKTISVMNKTNVPLNMIATVGVDVKDVENGTKAAISTGAISDTETNKKIMVTADFAVFDGNIYAESNAPTIRDDCWITASQIVATAGTKNTEDNTVTGGKAHTAAQAVKIPATNGTDDGANYVYVKFGGSATKAPTTPWTQNDKFDIITTLKFTPQATPEKRILVATQPVAENAYADLANETKPTFKVSYQNADVAVSKGGHASNMFMSAAGTYLTTNIVWPGYTVKVSPKAGTGDDAGKYFAISSITFRNEDGTTNTAVKATKTGNKSDAYYTFTMPDSNIQAIVTVAATAS